VKNSYDRSKLKALLITQQHTHCVCFCVCVHPAGKGDNFERCVSEAELLLDQSVRLEQAGEVTAVLSAVNEAVCKLLPMPPCLTDGHVQHLAPNKRTANEVTTPRPPTLCFVANGNQRQQSGLLMTAWNQPMRFQCVCCH